VVRTEQSTISLSSKNTIICLFLTALIHFNGGKIGRVMG